MYTLSVLALLVTLATAAPPPLPDFLKDVNNRDALRTCRDALKTDDPAQRAVVQGCVDSAGLTEETINDIKALVKDTLKDGISSSDMKERILQTLRDVGQAGAANTVMKCVAQEKGYVVDDVFNMEAMKAYLLDSSKGTEVEEKIRNAVDTCPAVVDFDVPTYMKCIMKSCAGIAE